MAEKVLLIEDEEKLARMVELELQYGFLCRPGRSAAPGTLRASAAPAPPWIFQDLSPARRTILRKPKFLFSGGPVY